MRQRISERNNLPDFSLKTEYEKLNDLFTQVPAFGRIGSWDQKIPPDMSYAECLSGLFLEWPLRGSFTTVEEMMRALQICEQDFKKGMTEDRLLDYIQFILNVIAFVNDEVGGHRYMIYRNGDTIYRAICENCGLILAKLGAEAVNEKTEIYVVYKDDTASAISIQQPDISGSITEYMKIDNRGDLGRKMEILCTLAKKLELHEKQLVGTEFKTLCSDTTFLLNKVARHRRNEDNRIDAQFAAMDAQELETWCDRAFQMFLACMAVLPYIGVKEEIKEIKRGELRIL